MLKKNLYLPFLILSLALLFNCNLAIAGEYAIITNIKNNAQFKNNSEAINFIKSLFLKQKYEWPNGLKSIPYDRAASSKEHRAILNKILNMSEAKFRRHWVAMKQKTGEVPPRIISRDKYAVKYVEKYTGAFTIINSNVLYKYNNVKVLFKIVN